MKLLGSAFFQRASSGGTDSTKTAYKDKLKHFPRPPWLSFNLGLSIIFIHIHPSTPLHIKIPRSESAKRSAPPSQEAKSSPKTSYSPLRGQSGQENDIPHTRVPLERKVFGKSCPSSYQERRGGDPLARVSIAKASIDERGELTGLGRLCTQMGISTCYCWQTG